MRGNPHLDVDTQAKVAPVLAAIHNFIREYDEEKIADLLQQDGAESDGATGPSNHGDLAQGPARTAEQHAADARRDQIATDMWQQYRRELRRRGME